VFSGVDVSSASSSNIPGKIGEDSRKLQSPDSGDVIINKVRPTMPEDKVSYHR
jgi:hypothetical protein